MRQLIIFIFAFLLYSNTFNHSYVLDDNDVIAQNSITRKGIKGIPEIFSTSHRANINYSGDDLYRPLSKALFALEWEVWPNNPSAAHIINVLLYAFLCCLIYTVLFRYFQEPIVPFIAAILFAAHPIHTEVVANIKSADEILALLFAFTSMYFIRRYSIGGKVYYLGFSVLSFFAALMSKESAVVFIGIIPLTIYFFTNLSLQRNLLVTAVHLIPLFLFLYIRNEVIGGYSVVNTISTNYLTGIDNVLDQKATAIMLLGYYLLLMFIPYKLMSDGSFNEFPAITITDWRFILPFIIFACMFIFALIKFRQKRTESYAILFFFIAATVASNIFILIGTNYGERLMFAPSVGICLLIATFIGTVFRETIKSNNFFVSYSKPLLASLVFLVPYSMKTFSRSAEWKDQLNLYQNDAVSAPNSARAQYYLGNQFAINLPEVSNEITRDRYIKEGINALNRAISILPFYDEAYYSLGQIYVNMGNLDSAAKFYQMAAVISPENARFQNNYGDIMFKKENYKEAKRRFSLAVKFDSLYTDALTNLGTSYARLGQEWLEYAQKAQEEKDDKRLDEMYSVSMAYYDSAIVYLNRSIEINGGFYLPYYVLGIVYQNKNDMEKANSYYAKAEELR